MTVGRRLPTTRGHDDRGNSRRARARRAVLAEQAVRGSPRSAPMRVLLSMLPLFLLAGCAARAPAPVVHRAPPPVQAGGLSAPLATAPIAAPGQAAPAGTSSTKRDAAPRVHVVRKGETLLSIALEYGLNFRDIARWNQIENVNVIRVGQTLQLGPPGSEVVASPLSPTEPVIASTDGIAVAQPEAARLPAAVPRAVPLPSAESLVTEPRALRQPYSDRALADAVAAGKVAGDAAAASAPAAPISEPAASPKVDPASAATVAWAWPAKGSLIGRFSDTNRGIDIAGSAGDPILASADGRVVYSGSGIRGYGRMLIVKHNDEYVSVYAHAAELRVKEGQVVTQGQHIADMGSSDADRVKLHFEIRRMGRPIDPLRFLPTNGAS